MSDRNLILVGMLLVCGLLVSAGSCMLTADRGLRYSECVRGSAQPELCREILK